jgi:hypothetical protein
MLVLVAAGLSTSSVCAQDELLDDLFPGIEFSRYLGDATAELYADTYARIEANGKTYVALTYYEPYPNSPSLRSVSYALLEVIGEDYRLWIDHMASDGAGSGLSFPEPFLYSVNTVALVVFPGCYRGCTYTFFRLDSTPTQVTLQEYDGLSAEESFPGPGDYRFDDSGLSATFRVALPGDATCCASGGTLDVFYELRDNRFRISKVERNASAQEPR